MDKFGVFKTMDALAGGDLLKYDEVLKQEYSTIVMKLQYDMEINQYQERLFEIKKRKNK